MLKGIEVLEEQSGEDFEPNEEDIFEYALFLGMSPEIDQKYLYIAREGLISQIPHPWKPAKTADGSLIYINIETNEMTEDHPLDEQFKLKYIQAKQNDTKANTGKQKTKLHNLVQLSRETQQQQVEVIDLDLMKKKEQSYKYVIASYKSNTESFDIQPLPEQKSKYFSNLASKLGEAEVSDITNLQPFTKIQQDRIIDPNFGQIIDIGSSRMSQIENIDEEFQSKLQQFEQIKKDQFQEFCFQLNQKYESSQGLIQKGPSLIVDNNLYHQESYSLKDIAVKKDYIKQKIMNEQSDKYEKQIQSQQIIQEEVLQSAETKLIQQNKSIIDGIIRLNQLNQNQKLQLIQFLKIQLSEKIITKEQNMKVYHDQLDQKFNEVKPKILEKITEDHLQLLKKMELYYVDQMQTQSQQVQLNKEIKKKDISARYSSSGDFSSLKKLQEQKKLLLIQSKQSDLELNLINEKYNKERFLEEEINKYYQKQRAFEIVNKQQNYQTQRQQIKKDIQLHLNQYRLDVNTEQEIIFKELELGFRQSMLDSQVLMRSQLQNQSLTVQLQELTSSKSEFIKQIYLLLNSKYALYQTQAELKNQMLKHQISGSQNFLQKKDILENHLRNLSLEKQKLKRKGPQKGDSVSLQSKTEPPLKSENIIKFIEDEKKFITHQQKILIDYKLDLKNSFALLQPQLMIESLENQNQSEYNLYNEQVYIARKYQGQIMLCENILKQQIKIVHQVFSGENQQDNQNKFNYLKEQYQQTKDQTIQTETQIQNRRVTYSRNYLAKES